ncbi:MAG TPA: substrate-binding domain-containing protein, partial [Propionibacteriaceae bacterium]|nr:substrate-binding domain-containing protein [Propionibacteriaceae bacterium]
RTRIGMVIGDQGFGNPDPRERGWRLALAAAGLEPSTSVVVPFTREGGYASAAALLAADPALDAVFASSDLQALGLVRALHERGIRIPEDLAVVSYDGTKDSEFCWPPLTVARQNLPALASAALDLLAADTPPRGTHIDVPTELVRRASCGCPTSS